MVFTLCLESYHNLYPYTVDRGKRGQVFCFDVPTGMGGAYWLAGMTQVHDKTWGFLHV